MVINTAEFPRQDNEDRQLNPNDETHLERVIDLQSESDRFITAAKGTLAIQAVIAERRRLRG
jgi:hypothetical protein